MTFGLLPATMERERTLITALTLLLLLLWLGFLVHRSPRFPGSVAGSVLAISAAVLIVLPALAYAAVKRVPRLRRWAQQRVRLGTLLVWHVYTSIVGSALALLHTAHRFDSTVGIALTAMMLLTVLSGYVGRHFFRLVSMDVREKQRLLETLVGAYNDLAADLAKQPNPIVAAAGSQRLLAWAFQLGPAGSNRAASDSLDSAIRAVRVATAIAHLQYAITAHERLKRHFRVWLTAHIATSVAFYSLFAVHVWGAIRFGLRW